MGNATRDKCDSDTSSTCVLYYIFCKAGQQVLPASCQRQLVELFIVCSSSLKWTCWLQMKKSVCVYVCVCMCFVCTCVCIYVCGLLCIGVWVFMHTCVWFSCVRVCVCDVCAHDKVWLWLWHRLGQGVTMTVWVWHRLSEIYQNFTWLEHCIQIGK